MLSTKHDQQTKSNVITLSEGFENYFDLTSGEISLSDNTDLDDEVAIVLDNVTIEEQDDSISLYTKSFDLVDVDGNTIVHIEETNGSNLYLTDSLISLYNKAKDKSAPISLENLNDNEPLFIVEINSKEVTGPIKLIKSILTKASHGGANDLDEFHQVYANAMISIGIKYNFVHGECILRSLIRKKSDITEFPDWGRNGNHNDYQLMHIHSALINNPSPLIRISTGYLKRHLQSTDLYKVQGASHMDAFYVEQLYNYIDN